MLFRSIGVSYGATAGYFGGRADRMMMRVVDIIYALPFMFFVILLMVVFGRHILLIFVAIGAVNWLDMARERIAFQGLPARICWVGLKDRQRLALAFNEMVRKGELKAPVVIGRDHLDSGSVASPNRETEAMLDGSDAVSDWPLLNALLNTAGGATWVSLHHGGGVGMGFSQHAGVVIVADGSDAAEKRLARVLRNDPATGVMRHADAGYDIAIDCARE